LNSNGNRKALSSILILIIVVAAIVVVVVGAVAFYVWFSPGNLKTEEMQFSDFTALEVGSAFEVTITKSNTYSVKITANERVFDDIEVVQTGDTLKIEINPGINIGILNLNAEIAMPVLNSLVFSGATHGTADGFNSTDKFFVNLSGASRLVLTNFETGDVDLELSGASTLTAQGVGSNLVSVVSGASSLDLSTFQVNDTNIFLDGASHATINVNGTLNAEASGASSLEYIGTPTLGNINTSGASTVKKK
jgi:hypothetical protein